MGWKITNEVTYSQREVRAILQGLNETLSKAINAPDGWYRNEKEFQLRSLQHDFNMAIAHILRNEKIWDDRIHRRDYITKKDLQSRYERPMTDISVEEQHKFPSMPDVYCADIAPEEHRSTIGRFRFQDE